MSDPTWDFEKTPTTPPPAGRVVGANSLPGPVDRRVVPSSPPQRPRPAALPATGPAQTSFSGEGSYLPPTPPPRAEPSRPVVAGPPLSEPGSAARESARRANSPSWGWRALVAFVAGGLLAAGGFFAAQWNDTPETQEVIAEQSTPVRTEQPTTPPVIVEPPDPDTTEPAAFVAQILGPSVVQVEIPNLGLGSGVVFDDGLILTNHHVIEGSTSVDIRTSDGRVLSGEVIGSDARTDIGVISVGAGSGLPVAQLALDDEIQVGQLSIAIGSPFQLQQTVTSGIISAVNRPIYNGVGLNAMIQTDAAINPGNSGGALADRSGRVIGINTAIQTDGIGNSNIGVGFAVPIETAINIADRIVAGEPMEPGFLGVAGEQPTDGAAGVLVNEVTAGSAAEAAGVRVDDRIITIDDAPITSIEELAGLVQTRFPGDLVELRIVRSDDTITITATLGER